MLLEALGALILIARDLAALSDTFYPIGALTFAIGLDLFAIASWRSKTLPRWILILLILSTVIGPIGFFSSHLAFLFAVSGIIFGIGLASTGVAIFFLHFTRRIQIKFVKIRLVSFRTAGRLPSKTEKVLRRTCNGFN